MLGGRKHYLNDVAVNERSLKILTHLELLMEKAGRGVNVGCVTSYGLMFCFQHDSSKCLNTDLRKG